MNRVTSHLASWALPDPVTCFCRASTAEGKEDLPMGYSIFISGGRQGCVCKFCAITIRTRGD